MRILVPHFLEAVRWKNLLLIILLYLVLFYKFLAPYYDITTFLLLLLATLSITAAGNLENDLYDTETDRHNRKFNFYHHHDERNIYRLLPYILYVAGLLLAWLFLIRIHKGLYILYFLAVIILLFDYNRIIKKMPVIGNFIISILLMLLIFNIIIFYTLHYIDQLKLLFTALFLFPVNMNRELAKDFLDRKGDRKMQYQTLPLISPKKALRLMFFHIILLLILLIIFYFNPHISTIAKIYYFAMIFIPVSVHLNKLIRGKINFKRLARFYKILLLLGLFGIILM